ncbi:MAG: TetR family transcriptional regulator C-terminal domain-containing protein [Alphaproteobacteria bacterium]
MLADPERRGCLIINTALEVAPRDEEIAAAVATYLGEVRAFFERAICAAQSAEETPATIDAADAAEMLLGLMLGIRVLGRTSQDRAAFDAMLRPVFALLQIPPTNQEGC